MDNDAPSGPALLKLRSYRSVYQMVSAHLKDERLRQAFSIQPLLVGGNPPPQPRFIR